MEKIQKLGTISFIFIVISKIIDLLSKLKTNSLLIIFLNYFNLIYKYPKSIIDFILEVSFLGDIVLCFCMFCFGITIIKRFAIN